MDFIALDVETANESLASICQLGLAVFRNGEVIDSFGSLIDPEDYFSEVNVAIHGITAAKVRGAPTFPVILTALQNKLPDLPIVCHTHFDRVAFARSAARYRVPAPQWRWLDSARVARRTWPDFAWSGFGLANIADHLGIAFHHHDAVEDARCCGLILCRAISESGISIADWFTRVERPIDPMTGRSVKRSGDGDGPLLGQSICFTGALSIPRDQAADIAHDHGAAVTVTVTSKTTMLVVGDQDISKLAGHSRSSKHRKAEQLIAEGRPIRIIGESDFLAF